MIDKQFMNVAKGQFEVKMVPQTVNGSTDGHIGFMSLQKTFTGDLIGTSEGLMLTSMSKIEGSAGYVAIERIDGTLDGKQGTFDLMHTGVMDRGASELNIRIVPDSGTHQLTGISGRFAIQIDSGVHSYELEYEIAARD